MADKAEEFVTKTDLQKAPKDQRNEFIKLMVMREQIVAGKKRKNVV